ncbi:unnamed protein product [Cuscuta epithymum]|uniref:F-box/LRR-repeat protein 15-like leucin rich repeat domain-containing protein n=1 Tax=Cuscuta epithymum TaxID=186058 RepID=A0AAV0G9M7_9ASTE|nr:unnamed protein product [Cuscuta epithymum]CAH9144641.1 unnamed protein product [Cuscuta epithymum]
MTVLRSREVGSTSTPRSTVLPKKRKTNAPELSTPTKSCDTQSDVPVDTTPHSGSSSSRKRLASNSAVRRRSLRLAAKSGISGIGEDTENLTQGSNVSADIIPASNGCELGSCVSGDSVEKEEAQTQGDPQKKCLGSNSRQSAAKIEIKVESLSVSDGVGDCDYKLCSGQESEGVPNGGGSVAAVLTNSVLDVNSGGNESFKSERLAIEMKGKGKIDERPCVMPSSSAQFEVGPSKNESSDVANLSTRLSREEKGKGIMVDTDLSKDSGSELETRNTVKLEATQHEVEVREPAVNVANTNWGYRKQQFKDIARENASRFALFHSSEEENPVTDGAARESQPMEELEEDWPGPFSTAMKIIKDRENKKNAHEQKGFASKSMDASIVWTPKRKPQPNERGKVAPSLQDLCMSILVKNADGITSLDCIPDVIRHKLCHILCDSRKMNNHFVGLLTCGSPTEIRLKDCSWLTEEEFIKSFGECITSNLTVLQLDQCGRCLPDYALLATLARVPNSLPALTNISLKGGCRLSDSGLSALVSAAPSLKSINLSQCSLLSSDGIKCLSESLGSVLKELYLDDCQAISALVLPSLLKLEHLEVLSVAGVNTVCDEFVVEFVSRRGQNMRELILKDCITLTDRSVKAVAEFCPRLSAIDLSNLSKLTDYSVGYLANGCTAVNKLILCRNAFSDEAIAAYLETRGNSLKELSLNSVRKVSCNTAMALAKCCRNLQSLDVSWCRALTDEALGLIADSCLSLEVLKLFGCTQVTNVFLDGHSNPQVQIIGMKLTPVLEYLKSPDSLQGPLLYSSA